MHYDNPIGLSNLIINEFLQPDEPLPVLKAREYAETRELSVANLPSGPDGDDLYIQAA